MRDTASAAAPGRVNLIGEHTDYHEGFVLPMVIPRQTQVTIRVRPDRLVHAVSTARPGEPLEYAMGSEAPGRGWVDYVQGVTATLAREGIELPGFDLRIESTIPPGAGVSSSAALLVALLRGLRSLADLPFDDLGIARLAHASETGFVGAPVGMMDHIASSLGRVGEALFLDTRTLAAERLPLPSSIEIAVIDSGITHAHAGGEYVARRRESFEAAARLGVAFLRDVDVGALPRVEALPPLLARRARHVVGENARVLAAVEALRAGDAERFGALLVASHASLRDDYQVSTPEVDALVDIAVEHPDTYGARLTGGGFGGAVVVAARAGRGRAAAAAIRDAYAHRTGRTGVVLVPAPE